MNEIKDSKTSTTADSDSFNVETVSTLLDEVDFLLSIPFKTFWIALITVFLDLRHLWQHCTSPKAPKIHPTAH
ncbi:unnamed protein product [Linum trigynum]|uniref:Uncharacterized protein n=1 Tax=Linum trigynum TaxID=586398 RepID=A0AAV2DJ34_9ROSI